jgi:hypothetical protein
LEVVGEVFTVLPLLLLSLLAAGVDDDAVPGLEVGVGVPALELGEDVERGLLLLLLTIGSEEDAVPELEVGEMAPGLDVSEEVELELILLLLLVTGPEDDRVTEGDVDGVEYVLLLVLLPLSPPSLIVVLALDAEELL